MSQDDEQGWAFHVLWEPSLQSSWGAQLPGLCHAARLPLKLENSPRKLNAVPQIHAEKIDLYFLFILQTILLLFMQLETVFKNNRIYHMYVILTFSQLNPLVLIRESPQISAGDVLHLNSGLCIHYYHFIDADAGPRKLSKSSLSCAPAFFLLLLHFYLFAPSPQSYASFCG